MRIDGMKSFRTTITVTALIELPHLRSGSCSSHSGFCSSVAKRQRINLPYWTASCVFGGARRTRLTVPCRRLPSFLTDFRRLRRPPSALKPRALSVVLLFQQRRFLPPPPSPTPSGSTPKSTPAMNICSPSTPQCSKNPSPHSGGSE